LPHHVGALLVVKNDQTTAPAALCIDLDGTLIYSDLLIESALALLQKNPLYAFAMIAWLLRGKAHLKSEISRRVELDVSGLPYNRDLLHWIAEHRGHRKVVLVTASDYGLARKVADHLGIFHEVIASDGMTNLSGSAKGDALAATFGEREFDYAGNATVDLKVWARARHALVVNAGERLRRRVEPVAKVALYLPRRRSGPRVWAKALRIHQWIKNLLIFLPVLAAHRILDITAIYATVLGFICFGVCASSVYLLNDLLDIRSDRHHPRKRKRPFAAGILPLQYGIILAPLLTIAAFIGALQVSTRFAHVLAIYYVLTLAYSFRLKQVVTLDVVVLAALYTVRIIAGTAAIHAVPSFWLLAFSMFIFLSLAILKRYTELLSARLHGKSTASGRGYAVDDLTMLQSLGGSSGYLSVLVLALYINSTASEMLYRHPSVLWMLCPVLLYWISRAWMIAHRGLMHDDPVVFAVTDRTSQILLVLCGIIAFGAV